jgi:hypothetical protein
VHLTASRLKTNVATIFTLHGIVKLGMDNDDERPDDYVTRQFHLISGTAE